ncbi:MAG: primosomal protein N' [Nitrospirota bacterium]
MYIEVVVGLPIDKAFTYSVPKELEQDIEIGKRVLVPFGKRHITGYIVNILNEASLNKANLSNSISPAYKVKNILEILDPKPVLTSEMLKLTQWIATYYLCSWGEAIESALPPGVNLKPQKDNPLIPFNKGELKETRQASARRASYPLKLTQEQAQALEIITPYIKKHQFKVFLLHGITGSGKTEIYLQAISEVLKGENPPLTPPRRGIVKGEGENLPLTLPERGVVLKGGKCQLPITTSKKGIGGRGAIVLVPEISLTPQTVERFKARFGERIAILHSRLSRKERLFQWRRIQEGEAEIVIGARSAVFAPLKNLGLIVIDEEHETTYKQYDATPRYQARDVAIMRAKFNDAVIILGSATPSLETFYNTSIDKSIYLNLPYRIDHKPLAQVEIIDMKEEHKIGNYGIFSTKLKQEIADRLKKQEQVIIFLNRRGFATFIQCRDCGTTIKCPNCEITLTYHFQDKMLKCHYCDFQEIAPETCPKCHGIQIKYSGTGTQKVENELQKLFPEARISRMDLDTTKKRDSHENILSSFQSQGDILVGTQMIAKGLDIPNITLVGVISADVGLNLPDFRASERIFGLLTQVAGRAGRGKVSGLVIIQTYNPDNPTIQFAKTQDYHAFYSNEITFRKELNYPPFAHLANIIIKGKDEGHTIKLAQNIGDNLRMINQERGKLHKTILILGPAPCPLTKIKQEYRWQILLKGSPKSLQELLKSVLVLTSIPKDLKVGIDIDPSGLL